MNKLTINQFKDKFPDEDACLDYLFQIKYKKLQACTECGGMEKFQRVKDRRAYQCPLCSHQLYPTANTVFHKTTTPLHYWFTAIYLFTTTRNGVAAKELERVLPICYKTALRMAHQIKKLMHDNSSDLLTGEVMMDEVHIGGLQENMHKSKRKKLKQGRGGVNKTVVFGMIAKGGLRVVAQVLPDQKVNSSVLRRIIIKNVDKDSIVVTDGHHAYEGLGKVFKQHEVVNHRQKEYVRDGYTTNHIENYWSTLKRMIKGTHIHVSKQHLPLYISENSFRYMYRKKPEQMLDIILSQIV